MVSIVKIFACGRPTEMWTVGKRFGWCRILALGSSLFCIVGMHRFTVIVAQVCLFNEFESLSGMPDRLDLVGEGDVLRRKTRK